MEEVRLIDANALHKRIEMNLHASNPFTIEECCYKDALNSVDEAPTIDPESLRGHAKWVKDKELKFIIVPLWAGENTVKGILIDTEGGPASEAVVQRVQEYIDPGGTGLGEGQANIGAHFTATSATAKRVNISFSVTLAKGGDLASVRSAAQTALKAQIKSINLTTDDSETPTLRISTVGNTIYSLLGVLDYANLRFNGQTANVEAGKEEVFVLGEVTVSETNPVS